MVSSDIAQSIADFICVLCKNTGSGFGPWRAPANPVEWQGLDLNSWRTKIGVCCRVQFIKGESCGIDPRLVDRGARDDASVSDHPEQVIGCCGNISHWSTSTRRVGADPFKSGKIT